MSYRDRDRIEPPLPKPYEFVPLPEGRVPTAPPAGHHRYLAGNLTGTLNATIVARSPIHVASGLLEPTNDRKYPMVKGHFKTNGRPVIPGTSLKGCIRSIVEAITRSSVQITRSRDLPREYLPSRQIDQLDIAQRIFGSFGYQGSVSFADAVLEHGDTVIIPSVQLFRPRSDSVDTYFDGRRPRGRKFYMHGQLAEGNLPLEACPIDSQFGLQMHFENLTSAELGVVLTALGLGEPRLWPKLGGAKPACLGTIEVTNIQLTSLENKASYSDFDAIPMPLELQPLLTASQSLVLGPQLKRLADVLRWPREDRACPDRNY